MLATLSKERSSRAGWIYKWKFDGEGGIGQRLPRAARSLKTAHSRLEDARQA